MAKKKKNIVYSTNPDYNYEFDEDVVEDTLPNNQQTLRVLLDKKQRKGKVVTLIEGFKGSSDDLKELGKTLKSKCGGGGSAKDGEILIQGDHRDKIMDLLKADGYKVKRVGGWYFKSGLPKQNKNRNLLKIPSTYLSNVVFD